MNSKHRSMRLLPWLLEGLLLLTIISTTCAGPVGPLPTNETRSDLKSSSKDTCTVGDVVYMSGDKFPGASPCERCHCDAGSVNCTRRCEPRPGCKAIHRPDQCCPTYQCECEQDGRMYANGEKLVDSAEPCRVCYCQGGEVVCRRIACFVRDDCKPRLVPGRCCPEYDNCPVRGVTAVTGNIPSLATISATERLEETTTTAAPWVKDSQVKQEITIKEITPVSEIPSISGVKIMEILPSPSAEVIDYFSSKSPLIAREVSTEKPQITEDNSFSNVPISVGTTLENINNDLASTAESFPSKISLNKDNFNIPILPLDTSSVTENIASSSTKATIIEEEDTSFFDHNPAFPPIPDDLSVLSNHGDEIVPEPTMENEHLPSVQDNISTSTDSDIVLESSPIADSQNNATGEDIAKTFNEETVTSMDVMKKSSSMLNLRAAISTEILNVPSVIPDDIDTEADVIPETTTANVESVVTASSVNTIEKQFKVLDSTGLPALTKTDYISSSSVAPELSTTTESKLSSGMAESTIQEQTTSSIAKSNIATEITSQPEISSVPIESTISTHQTTVFDDLSTNNIKHVSTAQSIILTTEKVFTTTAKEIIPEVKATEDFTTDSKDLLSSMSTEVTTENVEEEAVSSKTSETESVGSAVKKSNILADLINLVGDVASISDHADENVSTVSSGSDIPISEELIRVNTGYKSKNNNWNLNSITEVPFKTKSTTSNTKSKVIEIENDDDENITDSPAPFDKVEPTTKRPIIDNVGEDGSLSGNKTDKKEIEIITQSYVPTFNKRPNKVVMKKNSEKVENIEMNPEPESPKAESPTVSSETATNDYEGTESSERISETNLTSSTILQ